MVILNVVENDLKLVAISSITFNGMKIQIHLCKFDLLYLDNFLHFLLFNFSSLFAVFVLFIFLFRCEICNKSFNARHRLAAHMLRHEPEESKKFQCKKCEKRFPKKFLLNKHISLVHSNENEEIICHLCNKKFVVPLYSSYYIR